MEIDKGKSKSRKGFEFYIIKYDGVLGITNSYIVLSIQVWRYYFNILYFFIKR